MARLAGFEGCDGRQGAGHAWLIHSLIYRPAGELQYEGGLWLGGWPGCVVQFGRKLPIVRCFVDILAECVTA